jgi:hypothetical protein
MFAHVVSLPYLSSWLLYEYPVLRALFAGSMILALRLLVVFIAALRVLSIVPASEILGVAQRKAYSLLRSKIGYLTLSALRRNSIYQAPPSMKTGNRTQSKWWATQQPRHEEQPRGCELSYGEMPFYVKIAIEEALPAGWTVTGLAERAKIKVRIGRKWWQLPKVHAECVFGQLIHRDTTLAKYAWCWGDAREGSWRAQTGYNINRYQIDVENLMQVNIDNGRMRKIRLEGVADESAADVDLVNALAMCKL